ncbi:MAG TPA: bifunctional metallophosphatase/5'-nucleotidase [Candidatus Binatia bacterium]|jgi:uncharacterized HAD superfamily protein
MGTAQTIYVDMDDVLCETARGCLDVIERLFGKRVAYEQLTDFDLGNSCELSVEETAVLYHIVHHPEELLRLKPVNGAIAVLNRWIAAGFEIAIVTGRPPATYEVSLDWLAREGMPYHSFTVVDKYRRFPTETALSLSELAARKFVFAVEDSATMARYLAEQMQVPVRLFDRPWNRAAAKHPRITRHNHWFEIAAEVL